MREFQIPSMVSGWIDELINGKMVKPKRFLLSKLIELFYEHESLSRNIYYP